MRFVELFILSFFTYCLANDAVFEGNGESLRPIQESNVQMVSELIYITYNSIGESFDVEVLATFKNYGPERDLTVGFPFNIYYPGIEDDSLSEISKRYNPYFQVKSDGIFLETRPEYKNPADIGGYNVVYLFDLHFKNLETKILNHKYTVKGSYSSIGTWSFDYIMKTGSLWYNNIESIAIVLDLPLEQVSKFQIISPKEHLAFQKDERIFLTWKFQNIKPDFNLELGGLSSFFNKQTSDEFLNSMKSGYFMSEAKKRYYRNLIFAIYGYPFKNPFVRNQFYNPYSYNNSLTNMKLKQNDNFKIDDIPKEYMSIIEKLSG